MDSRWRLAHELFNDARLTACTERPKDFFQGAIVAFSRGFQIPRCSKHLFRRPRLYSNSAFRWDLKKHHHHQNLPKPTQQLMLTSIRFLNVCLKLALETQTYSVADWQKVVSIIQTDLIASGFIRKEKPVCQMKTSERLLSTVCLTQDIAVNLHWYNSGNVFETVTSKTKTYLKLLVCNCRKSQDRDPRVRHAKMSTSPKFFLTVSKKAINTFDL